MSEGPTIGDWTQYGWIPDGASSFPAMVRLRNAAWMVYYEPGTVVQRERAENVKLREELEAAKHDLQVFSANLARLGADNAKLREELSKWERLTAGIDLPEYPVAQFKPKDLERENAKLRECLQDLAEHIREDDGFGLDYGWMLDRMRELGVEV